MSSSSVLRLLWPGCQLGEGFSFFPPAGGTYVTLTILYAVQREARVSKAPGNPSTPGSGGRMRGRMQEQDRPGCGRPRGWERQGRTGARP